LQDQLATAITSAVQTAEQSGNTSNLASVIQEAVNQVFKNNGIDPSTLEQQAAGQTQGAHHHHHHHAEAGSAGETSGDSSQSASGTTSGGATTSGTTASSSTTSGTTAVTATQQASLQQLADLLSQIAGTSSGNQSINGFLFSAQT